MAKQKPTDITILGPQEAENLEAAMKYLGAGALLIGDIELLYMGITPLVMFPPGDPDSPDQLALLVRIACNQLMIGRMLFTKSVIAVLRQYQGDALMHLRRAIEGCTFTFRMSKHPDLCKVWCEAGLDDTKYDAYRKAFRNRDVYPSKGHADFHPLLPDLKCNFDIASKLLHGSVFASANHLYLVPKGTNTPTTRNVNFFDMPPESFPSTYFMILMTHLAILKLYGEMLQPHMTNFSKWKAEHATVYERVGRFYKTWEPTIQAWNAARNTRPTPTK